MSRLDERYVPATVKAMTEHELLKAAASLRGKRSWAARVKKWGGKKAASAKMKRVRRGEVINKKAI
jgi:hypothetical protein